MAILAIIALLGSTGCYYGHLAVGQVKLLWARQSVDQLLADPATDPELRAKLQLVQAARRFAAELGLEVQGQYTSYVPWPHDRIVTSIIATEPGEIEAANFCFPIVGEVPYKGFFDQERAEREAKRLRASGMDVCVGAIPAYSTLGWFDDPLTAPMLNTTEERLFETVIHELVHATVFVNSQPDFNEGVANFIGEEAVMLFYSQSAARHAAQAARNGAASDGSVANPRARVDDDRLIARTLMSLRDEIAQLYAMPLPESERETRREALEASGREKLAGLALTTRNAVPLSKRARINDACLAGQGTYVADTPRHRAVLEALGGNLERFIARLRNSARSEDPRSIFFAL
jgi:predicted aminopeptidase